VHSVRADGHVVSPSAAAEGDLQTSHMNKLCFSYRSFLASLGAWASTRLVPVSYVSRTCLVQGGSGNGPKRALWQPSRVRLESFDHSPGNAFF